MIEMDLSELAGWVLWLSFVLVLGTGWWSRWSDRKAERRSLRARCECRSCLAVFEDPGRGDPVECPSCGGLVRKGGSRALG